MRVLAGLLARRSVSRDPGFMQDESEPSHPLKWAGSAVREEQSRTTKVASAVYRGRAARQGGP